MIKEYVQDKKGVLSFFLCFIFTENITRVHNKKTGGKAFDWPVETEILLMQWASRKKL